jgi:hypothetical protein
VDAIVGGLSRIVQPFRVAINAKGGDCWHVYRKSVLVIDGKNHSDDGMFSGKNNNNDGMITGRKCQAGTRSLLGRRRRESPRSSEEIVQSCTQSASVHQGRG